MKFITITKDEFASIVAEVIEEWDKKATEKEVDEFNPVTSLILMLQNMAFASALSVKLFKDEE